MILWDSVEVVERCQTDRGELVLQKRGCEFEIISNGTFLMATYNGESERQLVDRALSAATDPKRVLIGGLGVGFSLQQALADSRIEHVDVFEIELKIVTWNQRYLGEGCQEALADPRTQIVVDDLVTRLYQNRIHPQYDVVCLDIDNGSDWTVHDNNARLYSEDGVREVAALLREGGVVSIWNARRDLRFEQTLERVFQEVHLEQVEQPVGEPDVVYVAHDPVQ